MWPYLSPLAPQEVPISRRHRCVSAHLTRRAGQAGYRPWSRLCSNPQPYWHLLGRGEAHPLTGPPGFRRSPILLVEGPGAVGRVGRHSLHVAAPSAVCTVGHIYAVGPRSDLDLLFP